MTFQTVSADELEALSFESGAPIEIGAHCAHLTIDGAYYCARLAVTT